jgi:ribosomal protein L37E
MKPYDNACDRCGRMVFLDESKASWANTYDFVAMEPKDELLRCSRCTRVAGRVRSNARPSNGDMRPYEGWVGGTGA